MQKQFVGLKIGVMLEGTNSVGDLDPKFLPPDPDPASIIYTFEPSSGER